MTNKSPASVLQCEQPKPADRLGDQHRDRAAGDQVGEDAGRGNQRQERGEPGQPEADAILGEEELVEQRGSKFWPLK